MRKKKKDTQAQGKLRRLVSWLRYSIHKVRKSELILFARKYWPWYWNWYYVCMCVCIVWISFFDYEAIRNLLLYTYALFHLLCSCALRINKSLSTLIQRTNDAYSFHILICLYFTLTMPMKISTLNAIALKRGQHIFEEKKNTSFS